MRILAALGGNALLRRGEKPDAELQLHHVQEAAQALAPLTVHHELIVCFGNGPQIGLLALESENDAVLSRPYPLDVLGAQTQGMIGYWLTQSLRNAGVAKPVLSIVTQTLVDAQDPAFDRLTKFVGPGYMHEEATRLATVHGWTIAEDGDRWRRVVASPEPVATIELRSIRLLLEAGTVVICGGGGGAPVLDSGDGRLIGVEAVVDKDLTAAALALDLDIDQLLLLTDVPAVMRDFATPAATPVRRLDLTEVAEMTFPAGSMAPKIEACRRFVAATGRPASIGSLSQVAAVLEGTAGTTITPGTRDPRKPFAAEPVSLTADQLATP
jgi:carbamate kinase